MLLYCKGSNLPDSRRPIYFALFEDSVKQRQFIGLCDVGWSELRLWSKAQTTLSFYSLRFGLEQIAVEHAIVDGFLEMDGLDVGGVL